MQQQPESPYPYQQPSSPPQSPYPYPNQQQQIPQSFYPYQAQIPPSNLENKFALQSLIWGVATLVIVIVALYFGYALAGLLSFYALYMGLRGLIESFRTRGTGLIESVAGTLTAALSCTISILAYGDVGWFIDLLYSIGFWH
jgi:hypothetical protein